MRTNRAILSALGVLLPIFILGTAGCEDRFASCFEGFDCPGDGTGPKTGGTSNSGGSESESGGSENGSGGLAGGGTSQSGGAGNVGGSANAGGNGSGGENLGGACGDTCTEEEPHCLEDEATCVECTKHAHCEDETAPVCGLTNTCDRCKSDGDCKDVLGLEDTPVCVTDTSRDDYGSCIGCLNKDDCGGAICDPPTWTCIPGTIDGGKGLCDPCIDDRECKSGQLCIEMTYDDPADGVVGSFCLWRKDATELDAPKGTCGINSRPYASTMPGATSANDVIADVCSLATTTCPALKQLRTEVEGCEMEGDDNACGVEGFNDGKCRLDGNSVPKCTYTCIGPEDCPGVSCFDTGSAKYCAL